MLHTQAITVSTPRQKSFNMSASNDGSESVDQFLARIASLKEGRDDDNVARTRQMEDEILKGRQERQARRLGEYPVSQQYTCS